MYIVALVPVLATHIFIFCTGSPIPLLYTTKSAGTDRDGLGYSVLFVHTWYRCCITSLNKRYLAQGAETAGLALGQWTRAGSADQTGTMRGQLTGTEEKGII